MSGKSFILDCLTKVEGHAKLNVQMDGKRVKKAEIEVYEPSRYFESMVVGENYETVPSISQRICGICSVMHTITAIKAVENAIGVTPSRQTEDLRRLLIYSSIIHSHAAHLFFFAAPDYLGLDDAVEMSRKRPECMKLGIDLQRIASGIVRKLGGRSLHPVNPRVGFFNSVPGKGKLENVLEDFKRLKQLSAKAARLFMSFRLPELENKTVYLGLTKRGEYPLYDGNISILDGFTFGPAEYEKHIKEEVVFHSTAKYARFDGKPFMVGSLSRLNLSHKNLSDSARSLLAESGTKVPCYSTFVNNFAQTLEMVHFADTAMETIGKYMESGMKEERPKIRPRKGDGIAACEAPRGTLYHHYRFDAKGRATFANIITPTCQNVRNMEFDMQHFVPSIIRQPDGKVKRMLEMLIRAYDPCFSCSSHFLDLRLRR